MKAFFVLSLFLVTVFSSNIFAQFKVPPLTGPVVDQAKVISYDDERKAAAIIRKLYDLGQGQLVLVTLPSLEGQTIEQIGIQIADQWKLGTAKGDNGILLIAAVADRAVRIEVGQGLEGTIPDATANRIIEDVIIPTIRSSGLSSGLLTGVGAIAEQIDPTLFQQSNSFQRSNRSSVGVGQSLGFIILVLFIIAIKFFGYFLGGRNPRSRYRGGWGGGRGGGGFGGGGFGGFGGGGGGFSGGGASGRW
jgi:uncharacterized protein